MMQTFLRHRSGPAATRWTVLLLLVLVVLAPTAVLTWLVGRAAQNERLVVRQRLAETHQLELRRTQQRIESDLAALLERCDRLFVESGPANLASAAAGESWADAVICFDEHGHVIHPEPPRSPAPDAMEEFATWREAARLEFQEQDNARAAERFAAIAAASEHPGVKARAWQGQARCLAKAGETAAAIAVFRQIMDSPSARQARDVQNRLIAADASLRVLELMRVSGSSADETQFARNQIVEFISREASPETPSSQRRFLARRLQEMAPGQANFPWLASEELAAEYTARHTSPPGSNLLQPTSLPDVWQIASPQRRVVLLWRGATLATRLSGELEHGDDALPKIAVLAPDVAAPQKHLATANLPLLPGWRLASPAAGDASLDAEASRQIALYVWTAVLAMGAVATGAALLARTLGRQHRLNQMQNDWLAMVSHELKTPLASIHLLTDALLEKDDVDRVAYLRLISGETARLTHLIERLLTLTRDSQGAEMLKQRPIHPAGIVESAVAALRERLHAPGCEFQQQIEPDLPLLRADHEAMSIVLINLLDNAWKFTGEHKEISLTVDREADAVCFRVQDNGIGIAPRDMRRVFDRFYQVDRRLSREYGGCGLGLSIVRQLVEAHGGSVNVDCRPGEGATFTVRIPATTIPAISSLSLTEVAS